MLYNGMKDYDIETEEPATLVAGGTISSSSFKIHVPKVLPLVSASTSSTSEPINKSIFINDTPCKPKCSSKIKTQGYITCPRFDHGSLIPLATPGSGSIAKGSKIMVNVPGKNIKGIRVIGVKV